MSSPASALLTTSRLDAGRCQSTNSGTASRRRRATSCFSTPAKRTKRGSAGTFRNGHRSTSRSGSRPRGSTKSSRSASTATTLLRTKATTGARYSPACATTRTRPRGSVARRLSVEVTTGRFLSSGCGPLSTIDDSLVLQNPRAGRPCPRPPARGNSFTRPAIRQRAPQFDGNPLTARLAERFVIERIQCVLR